MERREATAFKFFKFLSELGELDPGTGFIPEAASVKLQGAGAGGDWGLSPKPAMLTFQTGTTTDPPRSGCF